MKRTQPMCYINHSIVGNDVHCKDCNVTACPVCQGTMKETQECLKKEGEIAECEGCNYTICPNNPKNPKFNPKYDD